MISKWQLGIYLNLWKPEVWVWVYQRDLMDNLVRWELQELMTNV